MKRLLLSAAVLLLLVVPQLALGTDLDDFKAASEKFQKAWNSLDAATIASMIYPGSANFDRDANYPSVAPMDPKQTEAVIRANLQGFFAGLESLTITINFQYRVEGNTGLLWGFQTVVVKPKVGLTQTNQSRVTSTWMKSGDKWRIILSHVSPMPAGWHF